MTNPPLPAIFVSHGAPTLPLEDVPARSFLAGLGRTLAQPRAILVVSAHWETPLPSVTAVEVNDTLHDFTGFPPALYALRYPAPGSVACAERVADLLSGAGLGVTINRQRGLDHGAWVPLSLIYPDANIPVVQLSVQSQLGPGHHLQLGRALAPLRADGVLIVASGSFTHDLSSWRCFQGELEPEWVSAFADWFDAALVQRRICDLLAYRRLAPHALRNHPTEEHLLPLFVALGAGGAEPTVERLHSSTTYGVLRMDAYAVHAGSDMALTGDHQ